MVSIGKVRVYMLNRRVQVAMGVAGSGQHRSRVIMVVVLITFPVDMLMRMLQRFVPVSMLMLLGEV